MVIIYPPGNFQQPLWWYQDFWKTNKTKRKQKNKVTKKEQQQQQNLTSAFIFKEKGNLCFLSKFDDFLMDIFLITATEPN